MIKRVEIKGFRSCQDVVLDDLGGLTALVGRNAAGKTGILKAIEWAALSATTAPELRHSITKSRFGLIEAQSERPTEVAFRVALGGKEFKYRISQKIEELEEGESNFSSNIYESLEYSSISNKWNPLLQRSQTTAKFFQGKKTSTMKMGPSAPALIAISSLFPSGKYVSKLETFIDFLRAVRYYPLDEPSESVEPDFIEDRAFQEWLSHYKSTADPGTSISMRLLQLRHEDKKFEELKKVLGPTGLNIIDNIRVHEFTGGYKSVLYGIDFVINNHSNGTHRFASHATLSLGTRRLLRILVSYFFDKSSVMLIEHPEDGIHFELARDLIQFLQSGSDHVQTIVSSHSPDLLDVVRPEEVRLVTLNQGATQVRALDSRELTGAARYLRKKGALSDFLRLVDGD